MRAELEQGVIDGTYMQLHPGWGGVVEHHEDDRLRWPTYARVEQRPDLPAVLGGPGGGGVWETGDDPRGDADVDLPG
jgi:hypothetical protein